MERQALRQEAVNGAFGAHLRVRPYFCACLLRALPNSYHPLACVLVVIAILAITVFRPKLEELWLAISDGINSL